MRKTSLTTEQVRVVESLAGVGAQVDTAAGVIRGVKLIGFESKNGRVYPPDVLRAAVSQYENIKVNIDHPKNPGDPRSVAERIGVIKGARFVEGKGIFGDFHFNPKHQLAEQIAWDAQHNPEAVGFSHNATLKFKSGTGANGKRAVEAIVGVRSLDLVADPATTSGFFEHVVAEGLLADKAKMDDLIGAACDLLSELRYGQGGKLTPQERAARALSVARDLIAELEPNSKESVDMDIKNLTLEELRTARPDLIEAVTEQQSTSQELEQLKAKVAEYEKREARAKLESEIRTALEEAGLDPKDKTKVSDLFFEQLVNAADSATRQAMIADRKAVCGASHAVNGKPKTTQVTEGTPSDPAAWLKRLRSPQRLSV